MSLQYFFVISNGSSHIYEDNTRTEFKNNLPKPFVSQYGMNLAIDTVIFDNTFSFYKSNKEVDIVCRLNENFFVLNLSYVNTLSFLARKINRFFADITYYMKKEKIVGLAEIINGKIRLQLNSGDVAISPELYDFLSFKDEVPIKNLTYGEISHSYFSLRAKNDIESKIYFSSNEIKLNDDDLEYINISCENILPYPRNSDMQSIICSIPLIKNLPTMFYSPTFRNFFPLNSTILSSIKIAFFQPSGRRVYFQHGSPNILKMALSTPLKTNDFFYVQASSAKNDSFPENNNSCFQIELPKEYDLKGRWQVGVTNVYIPKPTNIIKFDTTIYSLPDSQNYFMVCFTNPIIRKKYAMFPLKEFSKRELVLFLCREFAEFFNITLDQNEDIYINLKREYQNSSYVQILTSVDILRILDSHRFHNQISASGTTVIWKERFKSDTPQFTQDRMSDNRMVGIKVNKTFDELKEENLEENFYFEPRVFYDVSDLKDIDLTQINTRRILLLSENEYFKKEEIRLLQHIQNLQNVDVRQELIPSFFFIYADFVVETTMADNFINLLKMVPYRSGYNNLPGGLFDFARCEFFDVNKSSLKTLSFEVRTHSGKKYNYFPKNDNIIVTMKFQRV